MPMRNLIFVAFVEPVAEGGVFPRTEWPLHITLVRFDVGSPAGADPAERVAALAGQPALAALGARLSVGEDAGFGRNGSVPVSLVHPQPDLQALHEQLVAAVEGLGGQGADARAHEVRLPAPRFTPRWQAAEPGGRRRA